MQSKKTLVTIAVIVVALILLGGGIWAFIFFRTRQLDTEKTVKIQVHETKEITVGGVKLNVEIADSKYKQIRGVTSKDSLSNNEGMLFIFTKPEVYSFWTKDMRFPIDIIWISEGFNIIKLDKDAQPCEQDPCTEYTSQEPAKYIIEVAGGWADSNNIDVGDTIVIPE